MARHFIAVVFFGLSLIGGVPGSLVAQDLGVQVSPILTVDTDRIFKSSRIGKQITDELEAKLQALVAENNTIQNQLLEEEQKLTEQRVSMEPAAFRLLADAFDQKTQGIRNEQDAKQRELQRLREVESKSFIDRIAPILSTIARERGAIAILERRTVLLSADGIDITNETIARINAALAETENTAPDGTLDTAPIATVDEN